MTWRDEIRGMTWGEFRRMCYWMVGLIGLAMVAGALLIALVRRSV